VNNRLALVGLALSLAVGACVADQTDPNVPSTTPTPAELRARVDRLVPPIIDRAADAANASASSLGAVAHTVGLPTEAVSTQLRPVFFEANAGARAAAWLDAVLSADTYDGQMFHLDPIALCGGDKACEDALSADDYAVIATPLDADGLKLALVRGYQLAPVWSIVLQHDGAQFSIDVAAVTALAPAFHVFPWVEDLARNGLGVSATGAIDGDLTLTPDSHFHIHIGAPVHVAVGPMKMPTADAVTSLDIADSSTIDVSQRGHGPVQVGLELVGFRIKQGGSGDVLTIDAEAILQASEAAITHLDISAQ
jgi:hypothetical protein